MMENKEQIMEQAEKAVLHTYNRYPVVLDRGEGVYLYDTEGKKYLDFAAGIAVQALGYHYPGYDEALKAQIDKLTHTSNLYYNEPAAEAAGKLDGFKRHEQSLFHEQRHGGHRGRSEGCPEICVCQRKNR